MNGKWRAVLNTTVMTAGLMIDTGTNGTVARQRIIVPNALIYCTRESYIIRVRYNNIVRDITPKMIFSYFTRRIIILCARMTLKMQLRTCEHIHENTIHKHSYFVRIRVSTTIPQRSPI